MRHFHSHQLRLQAVSTATTSQRSWIPTPLHLLVGLDPTRWSQRARRDERWQASPRRSIRN